MRPRSFAMVAVLTFSTSTRGQTIEADLDAALREYAEGNYRAAARTLGRAVARGGTPRERAKAYLYLGAAHAALKKRDAARNSFRRALELDPVVVLDPDRFVPAIVALFEAVRENLKGKIEVSCDRRDATVDVGGTPSGQCGSTVAVRVGAHAVRVVSGGEFREKTVVVAVGRTTVVRVEFGAAMGRLTVVTRPRGAIVKLAGQVVGETPLKGHAIAEGKYEMTLDLADHKTVREEVVIERGQAKELERTLEAVPREPPPAPVLPVAPPPERIPSVEGQLPRKRPTWPWIVVGVGGAAVGVGIAFGLLSNKAANDFDSKKGTGTLAPADVTDYETRASRYATAANVLFVAGGVATAAGAILLITLGGEKTRPSALGCLRLGPGMVRIAGEF